jgi:DNA topoisomerase-1
MAKATTPTKASKSPKTSAAPEGTADETAAKPVKKAAAKKSTAKKPAAKKSTAKSAKAKEAAAEATPKKAAKKTAAKKTAAKKTAAKKTAPQKSSARSTGAAAPKKSASKAEAAARRSTGSALVVVESPAKAKTIQKYLGGGTQVMASVGHVKDLPKSELGVDIEHEFSPHYVVIRGKNKIIADLRKAAKKADVVYLAPDPDREGEAIAWHLAEEIRDANPNIKRVLFNEITKRGITEAIANPTELDRSKFDAQQTRRVLDRLVGYQISPILWNKVKRGLSAGRVQSVAVRLVVDRESEIGAFKAEEYWTVEAEVEALDSGGKPKPPRFSLRLHKVDGQRPERLPGTDAQAIAAQLRKVPLKVSQVEKKERRKMPLAPFITSKLQQEAARKLRFTAKRTMGVAQRLYEGVELGEEGLVGLITYMRTDSTRISADALTEVRGYIEQRYGKDAVPDEPVVYKSKKGSVNVQDAHEAIRPTGMKYEPETVRRLLKGEAQKHPDKARDIEDQIKLYQLIWNRFVASQMRPAIYDQTTVSVEVKGEGPGSKTLDLRATGAVLRYAGFTAVYTEAQDEDQPAEPDGEGERLPSVQIGDSLHAHEVKAEQHFTQPPPRFTEASLVKELEEQGIGRPSTYAAILSTIQDRGYVEKREGRFCPTLLGTRVNELLVASFPRIVNVDFTAKMESDLDSIEDGQEQMQALLSRFYAPFKTDVEKAVVEMKDWKRAEIPTEFTCEKCGQPMVIKWGRNGEFMACSGYPECKNTKEFTRNAEGKLELLPEPTTEEPCPTCGAAMVHRRGRFGEFWACSRYPECKTTKPVSLGITCPRPGCGGFLTEKRSRRGTSFYGCSNYGTTKCDFVSWDRPIKEACPECGAPFLLRKQSRKGVKLHCASCTYVNDMTEEDMPEMADEGGGDVGEVEEGAA